MMPGGEDTDLERAVVRRPVRRFHRDESQLAFDRRRPEERGR